MTCRRATLADADLVMSILDAAAARHGRRPWQWAWVERGLREEETLVGFVQEMPVATATLQRADADNWGPRSLRAPTALYLHRLATSVPGKGYGAAMLAAAERLAAAAGAQLLRLDCAADHERLHRYYAELGYTEKRRVERGGWRMVLFQKRIGDSSRKPVEIRPLAPADSIEALTDLIHAAYRPLGEMGLNYTGVDQDAATTRRRIEGGECLVAVVEGGVVGTVTWYPPQPREWLDPWYSRPRLAVLAQLAVRPEHQTRGIGSALISEVERRARAAGSRELALDTAEPARHLIEYYEQRGFQPVATAQWKGKTYRSVVMSKVL